MSCLSLSESAKTVLSLQEERVKSYASLAEAHKAYLAKGPPDFDLPAFQPAVAAATQSFKEISEKILAVAASLEANGENKELVGHIRQLQALEEAKLKFTVDWQLAQQQAGVSRDIRHLTMAPGPVKLEPIFPFPDDIPVIAQDLRLAFEHLDRSGFSRIRVSHKEEALVI